MKDLTRALVALTVVGLAVGLAAAAGAGGAVAAGGDAVVTVGENQTDDVNEEMGTEEWNFSTSPEGVISSPTVVGVADSSGDASNGTSSRTAYVGSQNGPLYAIDAESGHEVWNFSTAGENVTSSPTVLNDTVYVGAGNNGSEANVLYALDAETGAERWTYNATVGDVETSPTVANGIVFFTSNAHGGHTNVSAELHAVDAETGESTWNDSVQFRNWTTTAPTVADGTVLVGLRDGGNATGAVRAYDATTGEEQWTFDEPNDTVFRSPTVSNSTVFAGSDDSTLYAIDIDTGSETWTYDEPGSWLPGVPTVHGNTVFVGQFGGDNSTVERANLHAVDTESGNASWTANQTAGIASSVTVADETAFVADRNGRIYAFDAANGTHLWNVTVSEDAIYSSPTVMNGTLYVGSNDGNVYAIDAGVDGDSTDSRVRLGTLGHHELYSADGGNESQPNEDTGEDDSGQSNDDTDDSSGGSPGFGPAPSPPSQGDGDEPAAFDVDLGVLSGGAVPGESAEVAVTVANTGDETGTTNLDVEVAGGVDETISVTLDGGEETTETVSVTIPEVDSDVEIDARSGDGTIEASTTLGLAEPDLVIESADLPEEATAGEDVTVAVTVANEGQIATDATVEYRVGGAVLATEDVTLEPGDSEDVSLSATVPESLDDGASQSVRVGDAETESSLAAIAAGDSVPGFGIGAALVGLLAALVARYRLR